MRILLAQINPIIGDILENGKKALEVINIAKQKRVDLLVFPELALCGYPPEDLLLNQGFIEKNQEVLQSIVSSSKGLALIIGFPRKNPFRWGKRLYNSAAVIEDGRIIGYQDKSLLPTYDVFDEERYFEPGEKQELFIIQGKKIAVTICEDIWAFPGNSLEERYRKNLLGKIAQLRPDLIVNLSASPFDQMKPKRRYEVASAVASFIKCPLILCNQVGANDALIFDGNSMFLDAKGQIIGCAKSFEEDHWIVEMGEIEKMCTSDCLQQLLPSIGNLYQALVLGVRDYFYKGGFQKACLGLSGGIDSAVVACIAKDALGEKNILGISMPSRYSSVESVTDALKLSENLGVTLKNISIESPFESYLQLLEPHFEGKALDLTEENLQARIRANILMAFSNKFGYLLLNTGNKSEQAMGYSTLYGDVCGAISVIGDLYKNEIYALAHYINREKEVIPSNILRKAPTAELRPNQKDTDSLPEYDIVDSVVKEYIECEMDSLQISSRYGYPLSLVESLIKKINDNEFKRKQSPFALKVSAKSFLAGRKMPIIHRWRK